jgi:hypothetical protein
MKDLVFTIFSPKDFFNHPASDSNKTSRTHPENHLHPSPFPSRSD